MRTLLILGFFFVLPGLSVFSGECPLRNPEMKHSLDHTKSLKSSLRKVGLTGTLIPQKGFRIDQIASKSAGSRLGLDQGDLLLRVNGVRIRTERDLQNAMNRVKTSLIISVRDVKGRGIYRLKTKIFLPLRSQSRDSQKTLSHLDLPEGDSLKR